MQLKKSFLIAVFLCAWSLMIIIIYNEFILIRQMDTGQDGAMHDAPFELNDKRSKRWFTRKRVPNRPEAEPLINYKEINDIESTDVFESFDRPKKIRKNPHENKTMTTAKKPKTDSRFENNVVIDDKSDNNYDSHMIEGSDQFIAANGNESAESHLDEHAQLIARLRKANKKSEYFKGPIVAVLVIACNRISVKSCLDDLVRYRPNAQQFPIIVSQDCDHEPTKKVIESFKNVTYMRHPDQSDPNLQHHEKKYRGYYKIARHYGWALNTTFQAGFEYVIIVEDDLNVAPDFYEYFLGTHELLKNDSSLWCISAWNDNGKNGNIDQTKPDLLYRTDFFPGLGWMLKKELWNELSVKWPKGFWDDWIREPVQRKGRACIRPELPRTRTFGKVGVSGGLFYDTHLKHIRLNEKFVDFTKMNLTYLLKSNYDKQFIDGVYSLPLVTLDKMRRSTVMPNESIRIEYTNKIQYDKIARYLGIMDDEKSGVPRTGYHGIVSTYYKGRRIYIAPSKNWKGYDLWILDK